MNNFITRSGQLFIKLDKPVDLTALDEDTIYHLGFTPKDITKIIGKEIRLVIEDSGSITEYPVHLAKTGNVALPFDFEFTYSNNLYVIEASGDGNRDEWVIVED